MHIQVKHIKNSELKTNKWSGGTTTQIAIFPENSSYSERTFDWRISTATVDVESSDFTILPGVKRFITSLKGDLKLVHQSHHTSSLSPYEVDIFNGDWQTKSYGKVTDFNLMVRGTNQGHMSSVQLMPSTPQEIYFKSGQASNNVRALGIYAFEQDLYIKVDGIPYNLNDGDFILVQVTNLKQDQMPLIQATSEQECKVCIVEIN